MPHTIQQILSDKGYLLADGAMGTGLMALGLKRGEVAESWNVNHPDRIASVHDSFIDAGADLILTNSFGGNRFILDRYELADQVQAYNEAAAKVSRRCADETGRPILVCGSMGPTGQLLKPLGKLTVEEAEEAYAEQAAALASGGVDYFWVETMSSLDEMAAAMKGAASTRLPFAATMSFDSKGRTMMGTTPEAALEAAKTFDPAPVAFGANCGSNPKQLVEVILKIVQSVSSNDIVIAKGNCGTPRLGAEGISYDGTPEIMADYACLVRDAGAHIIGGCCGTSADHLRAIGETLAARPRGQIPDQAKLVELLGEE